MALRHLEDQVRGHQARRDRPAREVVDRLGAVRERVQRLANRLVYGKRATPYEVLSQFSSRMAGAYANEDLLPRMARILAEGTGASGASVWLRVGGELRREAAWPAGATAGPRPAGTG